MICCVHVSADSYLSVHAHPAMEARELLRIVALKTERGEEDMVLAVASHTGGELSRPLVVVVIILIIIIAIIILPKKKNV